jgi:thiol:disulfide interchange protein
VVAALSELPGIQSEERVQMILERDAFTIEYDATLTSLEDMYEAISDLGYVPRLSAGSSSIEEVTPSGGAVPQPIAEALLAAQASAQLVFVEFFAQWCIACKVLEEQTLNSTAVQSALENYLVIKVDTDQFAASALNYEIVAMPTLLVLNHLGHELFRSVGPISESDLVQELESLRAGK